MANAAGAHGLFRATTWQYRRDESSPVGELLRNRLVKLVDGIVVRNLNSLLSCEQYF